MPNWPRNSCRAKPRSSRLELRPMVASSSWTCASVRPMPVSCTRSVPSPVSSLDSNRTSPGARGSASRRAVIASTAFCSSSRT
jgi:hypothetical protein